MSHRQLSLFILDHPHQLQKVPEYSTPPPSLTATIFLAAGHGKLKYYFLTWIKKTNVFKKILFCSPDTKSSAQVKKLTKKELEEHQEKLKHYGWVNILIIIFSFQLINIFMFLAVSWLRPRRHIQQPVDTAM